MRKIKVLFVCIHNSARSQMAEVFTKKYADGKIDAESAGIEPGVLNKTVVNVMKEIGIDISSNKTQSIFELCGKNKEYDYVITVCDQTKAEMCPVFPGAGKRLHWNFEDPSGFSGTDEEKCVKTREVRNQIESKIQNWIADLNV